MRKVVFEGTINGKTFDNVQDYNNEMQRLLSAGEVNIQASSNTRVVNEQEKVRKELDERGAAAPKKFDPNDFLPFFDKDSDSYYLDFLTSDDERVNERTLAAAQTKLTNAYKELEKAVENKTLSLEDTFGFVNVLKDIRSRIYHDSEVNRNAIREVNENITELTEKLKVLNNANPVIATVSEYYDAAFGLVKDYLLNL